MRPLGQIKQRFFERVLDGYRLPEKCPAQVRTLDLVEKRLRYGLAARGLPLTRNEVRLRRYQDRHRGQRCFILGNGPSLNACDLSRLREEVTFGVNSIFLLQQRADFTPTYYVVEDILVAEDRRAQIHDFTGPTKFFGNYLSYCIEPCERTIWLNVLYRYRDYPGFPRFSTNALKRLWVGGTVSYLCLQLAYYMGFREVYLVGFDHSYQIPDSAQVEGDRITSRAQDPNHFDGNYFGEGLRWHHPRVDRMELAYLRAKAAFEHDGRRIYNATHGGALEVFPRIAYEDVLGQ